MVIKGPRWVFEDGNGRAQMAFQKHRGVGMVIEGHRWVFEGHRGFFEGHREMGMVI